MASKGVLHRRAPYFASLYLATPGHQMTGSWDGGWVRKKKTQASCGAAQAGRLGVSCGPGISSVSVGVGCVALQSALRWCTRTVFVAGHA